jgi:hypothetical protein
MEVEPMDQNQLDLEIHGCLLELQRMSAQTASLEIDVDRLQEERKLQIDRIDRLADEVRKTAAKAISALDTAIRAELECYYLVSISDVLAEAEVLISRLDQCKAAWDFQRP